jgi:hypothetical protein
VNRAQKKRVYVGLAVVILALFCAGIIAGYSSRNDKICPDGRPPVGQQDDPMLGHTDYLCHNGKVVTK